MTGLDAPVVVTGWIDAANRELLRGALARLRARGLAADETLSDGASPLGVPAVEVRVATTAAAAPCVRGLLSVLEGFWVVEPR